MRTSDTVRHAYTSIGLARTIYIRCIYGVFGREITKYTVYIYSSGQPYTSTIHLGPKLTW